MASRVFTADQLGEDDDFLSDILLDSVGFPHKLSRFGVHKQNATYKGPYYDPKPILDIIQEHVIKNAKVREAIFALLEVPVVKAYLGGKTDADKDRFAHHARHYMTAYLRGTRFEFAPTPRYTKVTMKTELGIFAVRPIPAGSIISELRGSLAELSPQRVAEMSRGDIENEAEAAASQAVAEFGSMDVDFNSSAGSVARPSTVSKGKGKAKEERQPAWKERNDGLIVIDDDDDLDDEGRNGCDEYDEEDDVPLFFPGAGSNITRIAGPSALHSKSTRVSSSSATSSEPTESISAVPLPSLMKESPRSPPTEVVKGRALRDFSVLWSVKLKRYLLFLGPARFLNHDCRPTAELRKEGRNVTFKVLKNIAIGQEITTYYGDNYFGPRNCECLCKTCEELGRGHFANQNGETPSSTKPSSTPVSVSPSIPSLVIPNQMPLSSSNAFPTALSPESLSSPSTSSVFNLSEFPNYAESSVLTATRPYKPPTPPTSHDSYEDEIYEIDKPARASQRLLSKPRFSFANYSLKEMLSAAKVSMQSGGLAPNNGIGALSADYHWGFKVPASREVPKIRGENLCAACKNEKEVLLKIDPHGEGIQELDCLRCVRHRVIFQLPWPMRKARRAPKPDFDEVEKVCLKRNYEERKHLKLLQRSGLRDYGVTKVVHNDIEMLQAVINNVLVLRTPQPGAFVNLTNMVKLSESIFLHCGKIPVGPEPVVLIKTGGLNYTQGTWIPLERARVKACELGIPKELRAFLNADPLDNDSKTLKLNEDDVYSSDDFENGLESEPVRRDALARLRNPNGFLKKVYPPDPRPYTGDCYMGKIPRVRLAEYDQVVFYKTVIRGQIILRRQQDSWVNLSAILKTTSLSYIDRKRHLLSMRDKDKWIYRGNPAYAGIWTSLKEAKRIAERYGVLHLMINILASSKEMPEIVERLKDEENEYNLREDDGVGLDNGDNGDKDVPPNQSRVHLKTRTPLELKGYISPRRPKITGSGTEAEPIVVDLCDTSSSEDERKPSNKKKSKTSKDEASVSKSSVKLEKQSSLPQNRAQLPVRHPQGVRSSQPLRPLPLQYHQQQQQLSLVPHRPPELLKSSKTLSQVDALL